MNNPQGVPRPDRGQGLPQPGPVPVGPAPAVIDVHPASRNTEPLQGDPLRGQVLLVSRAPRVPDHQCDLQR